jgi:hypothetical protein
MRTHYDVLGVRPGAPTSEVRRAYVTLARQHHPDRPGGDADVMRAVNDAWATLRDPARRASYDLDVGRSAPPTISSEPPTSSEADDLWSDLLDDTPIGGPVVLPRWLALLPVAVFGASVAMFLVALLFAAERAIAIAIALFMVSCVMFLVAPFVALLASRHRG